MKRYARFQNKVFHTWQAQSQPQLREKERRVGDLFCSVSWLYCLHYFNSLFGSCITHFNTFPLCNFHSQYAEMSQHIMILQRKRHSQI